MRHSSVYVQLDVSGRVLRAGVDDFCFDGQGSFRYEAPHFNRFCVGTISTLVGHGHGVLAGGQAFEQDAFAGVEFVAGAPLIVERVAVMPGAGT